MAGERKLYITYLAEEWMQGGTSYVPKVNCSLGIVKGCFLMVQIRSPTVAA